MSTKRKSLHSKKTRRSKLPLPPGPPPKYSISYDVSPPLGHYWPTNRVQDEHETPNTYWVEDVRDGLDIWWFKSSPFKLYVDDTSIQPAKPTPTYRGLQLGLEGTPEEHLQNSLKLFKTHAYPPMLKSKRKKPVLPEYDCVCYVHSHGCYKNINDPVELKQGTINTLALADAGMTGIHSRRFKELKHTYRFGETIADITDNLKQLAHRYIDRVDLKKVSRPDIVERKPYDNGIDAFQPDFYDKYYNGDEVDDVVVVVCTQFQTVVNRFKGSIRKETILSYLAGKILYIDYSCSVCSKGDISKRIGELNGGR